jgi:hypothetical protein
MRRRADAELQRAGRADKLRCHHRCNQFRLSKVERLRKLFVLKKIEKQGEDLNMYAVKLRVYSE